MKQVKRDADEPMDPKVGKLRLKSLKRKNRLKKKCRPLRKKPAEKEAPAEKKAPAGKKAPEKATDSPKQNPDDIPLEVVKPKEEKKDKDKDGLKSNGQFSLDW